MATIYDVANGAGVSLSSVSAVINGRNGEVSAKKREKILRVIKELGFAPSKSARHLASGHSGRIAIIFPHHLSVAFLLPDIGHLFAGVAESAAQGELSVLLLTPTASRTLLQIINDLPAEGVDGAVLYHTFGLTDPAIEAVDNCPVPIVCTDSNPRFRKASTADTDNVDAIKLGVDYLVSQGHKRLLYLTIPPISQCDVDRIQGFVESLKERDLIDENAVRILPDHRLQPFIESTMKSPQRPTAIITRDAQYGVTVFDAASSAGMRIPDDLSIMTFDCFPRAHPGEDLVSNIVASWHELGIIAADTLRKIIDEPSSPPVAIRVPAQLIPRPSQVPTVKTEG